MRETMRRALLAVAALGLMLVVTGEVRGGFIGDTFGVTLDAFGMPFPPVNLVVVSPDPELVNFTGRLDINVEDASIDLLSVNLFGFESGQGFQGLRFTSLDSNSPPANITGFTLDVSPDIASFFGPERITFGPNFVNVDYAGTLLNSGDRVTINLQLTPSAVPEPASLALTGIGGLIGCGVAWRRLSRAA
jgi:hypothetical protein